MKIFLIIVAVYWLSVAFAYFAIRNYALKTDNYHVDSDDIFLVFFPVLNIFGAIDSIISLDNLSFSEWFFRVRNKKEDGD